MIPILLGALAGFLATLLVLAAAYRLLGWWREVPLDGEDFVLTDREWDRLSPTLEDLDTFERRLNGDT